MDAMAVACAEASFGVWWSGLWNKRAESSGLRYHDGAVRGTLVCCTRGVRAEAELDARFPTIVSRRLCVTRRCPVCMY